MVKPVCCDNATDVSKHAWVLIKAKDDSENLSEDLLEEHGT